MQIILVMSYDADIASQPIVKWVPCKGQSLVGLPRKKMSTVIRYLSACRVYCFLYLVRIASRCSWKIFHASQIALTRRDGYSNIIDKIANFIKYVDGSVVSLVSTWSESNLQWPESKRNCEPKGHQCGTNQGPSDNQVRELGNEKLREKEQVVNICKTYLKSQKKKKPSFQSLGFYI